MNEPLWRRLEGISGKRRRDAHIVYLELRRNGWAHDDAADIAAAGERTLTYAGALLRGEARILWRRLLRTITNAA